MKVTEAKAKLSVGRISDAPPIEERRYDQLTLNIAALGRCVMMRPQEDASNPEYPLQLRRQMLTTADYQRRIAGACVERWCRVDEEGEHPMANIMLQNETNGHSYAIPTIDGRGEEVDMNAIQALPLAERRVRSFLAMHILRANQLDELIEPIK